MISRFLIGQFFQEKFFSSIDNLLIGKIFFKDSCCYCLEWKTTFLKLESEANSFRNLTSRMDSIPEKRICVSQSLRIKRISLFIRISVSSSFYVDRMSLFFAKIKIDIPIGIRYYVRQQNTCEGTSVVSISAHLFRRTIRERCFYGASSSVPAAVGGGLS